MFWSCLRVRFGLTILSGIIPYQHSYCFSCFVDYFLETLLAASNPVSVVKSINFYRICLTDLMQMMKTPIH